MPPNGAAPKARREDELEFTTVELGPDAKAFRGPGGQMLVEVEFRTWAYSPTGATYRRLAVTEQAQSNAKGVHREGGYYQDPHGARIGTLFTSGLDIEEVEFDGISFSKVVAPREITLLPLPPMRSPMHLYRRPSTGQFIYLSKDRYTQYDYDGLMFKVFVGDGGVLHEVQIIYPLPDEPDWWHARFPTTDGTLDVPRHIGNDELRSKRKHPAPRWEGEELEELMLERFLIVETDTEVRLAPNPAHSSWDITNTDLVTDDTAWARLTARAQAQRLVEPLLADLRDPAKRASASVEFDAADDVARTARLLCPEHAGQPARVAGSLVALIDSILGVGRLGRRVLVPLPRDPRAAVILERLPYAEVSSWEVDERNGEPVVDVICRLSAPSGVSGARMTFTIARATALDGTSKNLDYAISVIEEEDAQPPQGG